jgi:N-methylhydantoinase A
MAVKIAIDVGGTFTDVFAVDDTSGRQWVGKVSTVPEDPSKGVFNGVQRLLKDNGIDPRSVAHLSQGTTVATNAILQRKGARTALLTTRGFRDVIEIGRQKRPDLYDLAKPKVVPLVPEELRFEVAERIRASGTVEIALSADEVREVAKRMAAAGVEAVAICFLHAYRYPAHELLAARILREELPAAYVCCSSEVVSEFREYERTVTTALNAMLGPVVSSYVGRIKQRLSESGVDAAVSIVQSNGGMVSADVASDKPVYLALSGPSAGVAGAALIAREAGFPNAIAFDMGGTSTDVCLIPDGRVPVTSNREIAGLPCRVPMVDIETVGAGGGSIAWVDVGNFLKVGPQSAGAVPGPVAYGKGNTEPTVTDANLVLNRLGGGSLLGGELTLDRDLSYRAIEARVARVLGLSVEEAALGMIRIANANMVRAVRSVSLQRGVDPRDFALLAFGGAGPMHAVSVARELGIKTVLIPPSPGVLCAIGTMGSDVRTDLVKSVILPATEDSLPTFRDTVDELTDQARRWLEAQGYTAAQAQVQVVLDMRYKGQSYELQVHGCTLRTPADVAEAIAAFHRVHETAYGYSNAKRVVQVINVRVTASIPSSYKAKAQAGQNGLAAAPKAAASREVLFDGMTEPLKTPVRWRSSLSPKEAFEGPAIIESMDSTVLVPTGAKVRVDGIGNLIIT